MRDLDTAAAVLNVAETGHLVLSTSHAPSAHQAVERMIDLFPPNERYLAQMRLASLLVSVICQTLVPRANGSGRVAAVEIMMANAPVKSLIRDGKIYQLPSVIRTHHSSGMISMDESLLDLYTRKVITKQALFDYCADRHEVETIVGKLPEQKKNK
jgi:twitching motility protein PilT